MSGVGGSTTRRMRNKAEDMFRMLISRDKRRVSDGFVTERNVTLTTLRVKWFSIIVVLIGVSLVIVAIFEYKHLFDIVKIIANILLFVSGLLGLFAAVKQNRSATRIFLLILSLSILLCIVDAVVSTLFYSLALSEPSCDAVCESEIISPMIMGLVLSLLLPLCCYSSLLYCGRVMHSSLLDSEIKEKRKKKRIEVQAAKGNAKSHVIDVGEGEGGDGVQTKAKRVPIEPLPPMKMPPLPPDMYTVPTANPFATTAKYLVGKDGHGVGNRRTQRRGSLPMFVSTVTAARSKANQAQERDHISQNDRPRSASGVRHEDESEVQVSINSGSASTLSQAHSATTNEGRPQSSEPLPGRDLDSRNRNGNGQQQRINASSLLTVNRSKVKPRSNASVRFQTMPSNELRSVVQKSKKIAYTYGSRESSRDHNIDLDAGDNGEKTHSTHSSPSRALLIDDDV